MFTESLLSQTFETNLRLSDKLTRQPELTNVKQDDYLQALQRASSIFLSYLKVFYTSDGKQNHPVITTHISFLIFLETYYEWLVPAEIKLQNNRENFYEIFMLALRAHLKNNTRIYFTAPHTPDPKHLADVVELIEDLTTPFTGIVSVLDVTPDTMLSLYRYSILTSTRSRNMQKMEDALSKPYANHSRFRFNLGEINITESEENLVSVLVKCKPLIHSAGIQVPKEWLDLLKVRGDHIMAAKEAIPIVSSRSEAAEAHQPGTGIDSSPKPILEESENKEPDSIKKKIRLALLTPLYLAIEVPFVALVIVILMLSMCKSNTSSLYDAQGLPVETCTSHPYC